MDRVSISPFIFSFQPSLPLRGVVSSPCFEALGRFFSYNFPLFPFPPDFTTFNPEYISLISHSPRSDPRSRKLLSHISPMLTHYCSSFVHNSHSLFAPFPLSFFPRLCFLLSSTSSFRIVLYNWCTVIVASHLCLLLSRGFPEVPANDPDAVSSDVSV